MRIGVLGAGSIGCYLGGRLMAAGHDVRLIGRQSLVDDIARSGLSITDCDGFKTHLGADRALIDIDAKALADCNVVLVTVKSKDTEAAGVELKTILQAGALVVSFQNGVRNAEVLTRILKGVNVVAGMVPFNVLRLQDGTFHRGTSGELLIGMTEAAKPLALAMTKAGLPTALANDVVQVQWGKLLFNLNNALNALAGVPLREQLGDRQYRRILAACMSEALHAMDAAKIKPAASLKVPPAWVPHVLRLPNALFFRLASTMLKIDPNARSSMWDDLTRGRTTEVDVLNGEIVRLAESSGLDAPVNKRVVTLVKGAEAAKAGSPMLKAADLARQLGV